MHRGNFFFRFDVAFAHSQSYGRTEYGYKFREQMNEFKTLAIEIVQLENVRNTDPHLFCGANILVFDTLSFQPQQPRLENQSKEKKIVLLARKKNLN